MEEKHDEKRDERGGADRIRWDDDPAVDVEAGRRRLPALQRTGTAGSLSIHSVRSRRASVDATVMVPIQYRTMSFDIEDYQRKEEVLRKAQEAPELADLEWHTLPVEELFRRLSSSPDAGLSTDQVTGKAAQHGKNAPTPPPSHRTRRFLGYLFKGFGPILLIASILVFIAWRPLGDPNPSTANLALAIVLLAVFFIQAGFNMWQDWSSARVMNSIRSLLPDHCQVIRDGGEAAVLARDLVPGDVVLIRTGDKLPADVRFFRVSSDARFDRSVLTGESVPIPATVDSTDENYLETRCIGMQGTHCAAGTGAGVVVAIGDRTVFGRIARLTSEPKPGLTTLEREVLNFVVAICSIMSFMIALVIIVWAAWLRRDHPDWITVPALIVSCVSVAVAFIPEGLPVALAASMTISANMMRRHKILCKSLKTVETLGAVSVICSDKTGTLTQNKMVVTECAIDGGAGRMTADRAREGIRGGGGGNGSPLQQLRAVAGLCNAGQFDPATAALPLSERVVFGDATDQAILRFSESLGSVADLRRFWQTRYELAFNSKNKFMIRAFGLALPEGSQIALPASSAAAFMPADILLTIKGASDVLMGRVGSYVDATGEVVPFGPDVRARVETARNEWSAQGRRVLLLARKKVAHESMGPDVATGGAAALEAEMLEQARSDLTLVGLVAIVDPPRPEIPGVVRTLRGAGIRIFMVTGDFALTAQAIAVECGIVTAPADRIDAVDALSREEMIPLKAQDSDERKDDDSNFRAIVLSGPELITLNDAQWDRLARQYREIVFARTTPEQKLRIVRELQARSNVVAMTGDGVNDAPSLRAADVGIALGSGSDMAIEAADMVLLESFSSVVEAVRYGRVMFDNLKKTVAYLLPAGAFSEFWPVMTNVLLGLPQILGSFQMIIICLFTDAAGAIALAYETPEADVLMRPPRVPGKDRLVDANLVLQSYVFVGILETICSFAMAYWHLQRRGVPFSELWLSYGRLPESITADEEGYTRKLAEASSVYFVTLVVMQWFNLMAVRTRRLSIFQHPPAGNARTQNWHLFPAIAFALAMIFFWCYVPPFQSALGTAQIPVEYWFLPMAFGMGVLVLDELRKMGVRKWPGGLLARLAW